MPSILPENQVFPDDDGEPIVNGSIYIGVKDQDPVANPITIYSDRELTTTLTNPQATDSFGRSVNKIWVPGKYSIQVNDEGAVQRYQDLDAGGQGLASEIAYNPMGAAVGATTVQARLQETVSVKSDYGAVGDGVADDTDELQAALDSGATIIVFVPGDIYKISSPLTISANTTIWGYGAKILSTMASASTAVLQGSENSIHILGLEVEGVGNSIYISENDLIRIEGSDNSPLAPDYINDLIIRDCHIHDAGSAGIRLRFVEYSEIKNNIIEHCGREGMILPSVNYTHVDGNTIRDINPGDGADSYGISFSKKTAPSLAHPPPKYCTASNNIITDVDWTGIDSHGGKHLAFIGNTIEGCRLGIGLVKESDGVNEIESSDYCTVSGNTIDSQKVANVIYGIALSGDSTDSLFATGNSITGNTILEHGNADESTSAAIYINTTKNTTVSGNTIEYPGSAGVMITIDNYGFSVTGNSIKDPWSDTITAPRYVRISSNNNFGSITGNSFYRDNTAYATYVGVRGIELSGSNTEVNASFNHNEATVKHSIVSTGVFVYPPILQSGSQTGVASIVQSFLDIVVTFPKTYSATPDITVSTHEEAGTSTASNTVHVTGASTTGFTARISTTTKANFSSAFNFTVYWNAAGY